jgi:hypothetical protein
MKKLYAQEFLSDPEGFLDDWVKKGEEFAKAVREILNRQNKTKVDAFIDAVLKDQFTRSAFLPQHRSAIPESNGEYVDNKKKALKALVKLRSFRDEALIDRIDDELLETEDLLRFEIHLNDLLKTGGGRYELYVGDLTVLASLVRIYESFFPHLASNFENESLLSMVASELLGRKVPEKALQLIELFENFNQKNLQSNQ